MATVTPEEEVTELVTINGMKVLCSVTRWCGLLVFTTKAGISAGGKRSVQAGMEFAGFNRETAMKNAQALMDLAGKQANSGNISLPCFILFRGKATVSM